jgi:hypothetical protein
VDEPGELPNSCEHRQRIAMLHHELFERAVGRRYR